MHTNCYTMAKNVFYMFAQMYTSYLQQSISRCLKGQNDEKKWIFCQCGPQKTKKNKKDCYLVLDFFKICSQSYTVACLYCFKTGSYKWADRMCFLACGPGVPHIGGNTV